MLTLVLASNSSIDQREKLKISLEERYKASNQSLRVMIQDNCCSDRWLNSPAFDHVKQVLDTFHLIQRYATSTRTSRPEARAREKILMSEIALVISKQCHHVHCKEDGAKLHDMVSGIIERFKEREKHLKECLILQRLSMKSS